MEYSNCAICSDNHGDSPETCLPQQINFAMAQIGKANQNHDDVTDLVMFDNA